MPTSADRQQLMESKSREQLLEMINKPEDWMPEVIEAAKIELDRRGEHYAVTNEQESSNVESQSVISVNQPKWNIDWADFLVPVLSSVIHTIKQGVSDIAYTIGAGVGYALVVFLLFAGTRQLLWMNNRKRPNPKPKNPILAAIIGIIIFAILL